jgi:hypothetical protein
MRGKHHHRELRLIRHDAHRVQKVSKWGKGERRIEIGDQRNKAVEYAIFKRKTSAEVRVVTMLGLSLESGH